MLVIFILYIIYKYYFCVLSILLNYGFHFDCNRFLQIDKITQKKNGQKDTTPETKTTTAHIHTYSYFIRYAIGDANQYVVSFLIVTQNMCDRWCGESKEDFFLFLLCFPCMRTFIELAVKLIMNL